MTEPAQVKLWKCACRWSGRRDELKPNASDCLVCPSCGASGALILSEAPPEPPELLPCPFCGEQPVITTMTATPDAFKVRCNFCWARSGDHKDVETAANAWNTRHRDDLCGEHGLRRALEIASAKTSEYAQAADREIAAGHDSVARAWELWLKGALAVRNAIEKELTSEKFERNLK